MPDAVATLKRLRGGGSHFADDALGKTEVEHLGPSGRGDDDVLCLQIPVQNTAFVSMRQGVGHLNRTIEEAIDGQAGSGRNDAMQRLASTSSMARNAWPLSSPTS